MWKNKRIEMVTCSKLAAIELELYYKITLMYKCCWHWTNQCLVNNNARNNETGTMTCSKWPTHRKCKEDGTSDTGATDMKQISIWFGKQGRKQITKIINCSKSTENASRSCKRNDTDGVCWWHWTDHYIVETYAITSKY